MSSGIPAPATDSVSIQAAEREKAGNDQVAAAANKAQANAQKAYDADVKAAQKAEDKAKAAETSARRHPSSSAQSRADTARASVEGAQRKLEESRAELEEAKAAAARAAEAKAKTDTAYAKLKNDELRKSLPSEEFDEILKQIELNCGTGHFVDGVVKPCPGTFKKRNCAGSSPPITQRLSKTAQEAINNDTGTTINYEKLADFEGGQATSAYVPWWPKGVTVKDGVITADTKRVRGTEELAGESKSGVTVGTGVDLGQQEKSAYFKRLREAGATQELLDKLDPYMGLKRSAACRYLREHPLTLTQDEVDLIDSEMQKEKTKSVKNTFNNFSKNNGYTKRFEDLSEAERTILLSRQYNTGSLNSNADQSFMLYIAKGKTAEAAATLTVDNYPGVDASRINGERGYLEGSYVEGN
ncbi:pesticin C-terminus-like muramidase [Pseudomonas sp. RIT-PI-AD]|uniref:pesticin C-terminus-like muramidase n=1 Tax=Pseudomonas sp. RIT-PI-AD TaxID=3035294 RepID=UPI0021D893A7|nr:pesticin C-terminus-like muramidase [Pseudomonas sp. RIT-PI-AD]